MSFPQLTRAKAPRATCQTAKHPKDNKNVPATIIQNTTGNPEPLIYWTDEVAGENPWTRCERVSNIILRKLEDKTWNRFYLRAGTSIDKYPIICFVSEPKDQACDPEIEIIVKLKRGKDAKTVLRQLLAISYKTPLELTGNFSFYYGEIHRDFYIDVEKFLEKVELSRNEEK
jgi:hypothetical protein